jgi:mitogen-activated protein kinase 1/3
VEGALLSPLAPRRRSRRSARALTRRRPTRRRAQVGARYALLRVLGYGSFSCVCLALDRASGERVALKRIPDVLATPEAAKRCLREIAIMRRAAHPNLVALRDAFVRPSSAGQRMRLVGGRLEASSLDLYLSSEFCGGGDLFHVRGQLSRGEARALLWQLLQALLALHSLGVWHRDVKSQNVFLQQGAGGRVVKLGDFGSARPAAAPAPPGAGLHHDRSFADMDAAVDGEDLLARPCEEAEAAAGGGGGNGFRAPLTRVVATPCYRAPEVVLSRGDYSSAMDAWGAGCVFGELLARVAPLGGADTPHLKVAPLFAVRGGPPPRTPPEGTTFGEPGCETTCCELEALFSVIGTPAWADAAAIGHAGWRRYLTRLPGRAPTLVRRFRGAANEAALHLLSRLLEFDPARRAGCEEALAHEFFAELRGALEAGASSELTSAAALDGGSVEAEAAALAAAAAAAAATQGVLAAGGQIAGSSDASAPQERRPLHDGEHRYWEEALPGPALALLEAELEEVAAAAVAEGVAGEEGRRKLRRLLELECEAVQAQMGGAAVAARGGGCAAAPMAPLHRGGGLRPDDAPGLGRSRSAAELDPNDPGAGARPPADLGRERLSNVADVAQGRELDPRKILAPARHGEWTPTGGGGGPAPGPRWGVTAAPPGADPRLSAAVAKQQGR